MEKDTGALDSVMMNQVLKGDTFPANSPDAFLDNSIRAFFDELLAETGQAKSEVIREANLPRTYGYQIFDGTRLAQRDYYLRIAIAMRLDLRTTQRLLAVTKSGSLHSLIKRDAAIIFAINHGYDNIKTYTFLTDMGLAPLEKDEDGDE